MYYFWALIFSLNTAPVIFTRIVESMARNLRQNHCLHVHVYLDNWLFQHQDREILLELAPGIVCIPPISGVGGQFGEVISDPKSEFRVSQSSLPHKPPDSSPGRSPARQAALRSGRNHEKDTCNSERLQAFLGLINFFALIVNLGRLHMRLIQLWLGYRWDHSLSSIDLPLPVIPIFWK